MAPRHTETTHPNASAFPRIGGPALRALATAGIWSLAELTTWTERDLLALHGMGAKGVRLLEEALAAAGKHLRDAR